MQIEVRATHALGALRLSGYTDARLHSVLAENPADLHQLREDLRLCVVSVLDRIAARAEGNGKNRLRS